MLNSTFRADCDIEFKFVVETQLFEFEVILQAFDFLVDWNQRTFRILKCQSHQF